MARKRARPLTKTQEDDFVRGYRLSEAFGAGRVVTIDGVTLDLRCELDTDLWRPGASLGTYGHRAALHGPRILFPWTSPDWRAHLTDGGDAVEATAGSTVRIATIASVPVETAFEPFEAAESRERKFAYLVLETPDGGQRLVERPLVLVAETATALQIEGGEYQTAARGLVAKLERLSGLEDLESMLAKPRSSWRKPDRPLAAPYAHAFLALGDAIARGEEHSWAAFGFMMARAEAEAELLPAATRGRLAQRIQAKGAQARRQQSREDTERLRELAKAVIARDADISLSACARAVEDRVAADPAWPFKSDSKWITRHIRELFEPRPGRNEFRPRRTATGD